MTMHRALAALFAASLIPLVAACGSTVVYNDGDGGNGAGGGECGVICDAPPNCGANAYEVESCPDGPNDSGCYEVTQCCTTLSCQPYCNGDPNCGCESPPMCPSDTVQVPSCSEAFDCFSISDCGATISCQYANNCDGYPSCDSGDAEVDSCPTDVSCYEASLCGSSIFCIDTSLPEHGCPSSAPDGLGCNPTFDTQTCDYTTSENCFDSYECEAGGDAAYWTFIGGGCAGSDGSGG